MGQYIPRYSISNVPTDVVNNTPDPGYFGGDWGIYVLGIKLRMLHFRGKPDTPLGAQKWGG